MTRSSTYNPRPVWRKLIWRAVATGVVCCAGTAILWLILPQSRLPILVIAFVLFLFKLARDLYLCSLPFEINEAGIRIGRGPLGRSLTDDPQQAVSWSDIAHVTDVAWDFRHLIEIQKRDSRVFLKGEELLLTAPFHENSSAVLRRCLLLSSDIVFQSSKTLACTLVPSAALDRVERRNLNKHLLELESRNAGTVMIWLGANDHRSREQVATMVAERLKRLRAAALAELQGFNYQIQHRWAQARDSYQQAFDIYRRDQEIRHLVVCARNLARSCIPLGKFREARELLEMALQLAKVAGNLHEQAECYNQLSQVFMETRGPSGRQEALSYLDHAERLFRRLNDSLMEANACGNKGMIYQTLAQLAERSPETWWFKCRIEEHVAHLRSIEGMTLDEDTWLDCALACHRRALSLIRKNKQRDQKKVQVAEARQLGCIAEVCWRKGRFEDAVNYYEEQHSLLDSVNSGGFAQDVSAWGLSSLDLAYSSGIVVKPEALDEGLRLLGKSVMGARAQSDQTEIILAHARRGQGFKKIGNLHAAYRDLSEAVSIVEKIRPEAGPASARAVLLHEYQDVYGDLIETLLDLQAQEPDKNWGEYAFEYCERAKCRRFMDVYLSAATHKPLPKPTEVLEEETLTDSAEDDWEWLIEDATDYQEVPPIQTTSLLPYDEMLKQSITSPETLVLQVFAREARTSPANSGEAMLAVIPATADGLSEPICYRGVNADEVFEAAANLKKYVGTPPIKSVPFDPEKSGALKLYEALIGAKQVARLLCPVDSKRRIARIVIVPFGRIFNDVPFCALHNGSSFLIEEYEVSVCPSLQWLSQTKVANQRDSRTPGKCLLLAADDSDLKGHADAIYRGLESQFPGGVSRRNGRVENTAAEAWKTLFESAEEYNQITIVAHGDQWPRPLLHFGDRKYSANWDVSLRDVYSSVRLDCDLLVMFACFAQQQNSPFTGEWESLASAFLVKGARAILAAQYSVHTWGTSILLHEVFKELVKGHSVSSSLKSAQCAFIQRKHGTKYRHPYYWAMTCVGYAEQEQSRTTETRPWQAEGQTVSA